MNPVISANGDKLGRAVAWNTSGGIQVLALPAGMDRPDVSSSGITINERGLIGGGFYDGSVNTSFAAYWTPEGEVHVLPGLPGSVVNEVTSVNNLGWFVGVSDNQAVIWQPVPEPSSLMVFAGLGSLWLVSRRRSMQR